MPTSPDHEHGAGEPTPTPTPADGEPAKASWDIRRMGTATRLQQRGGDEEMPRLHITRDRALLLGLFILSAIAFLYFVLPQLSGVRHTWDRLNEGDPWWIGVAAVMQIASMAAYIARSSRAFTCRPVRGSAGARPTKSRWRAWRPRACSPPVARAASR